jgi:hypothetical protein
LESVDDSEPQHWACLRATGDNLGQQENTRAKESVGPSTHRICRHCDITNPTILDVCNFLSQNCRHRLTTASSHKRDLKIVDNNPILSKWLGVNGGLHAFVRFKDFDITNNVPSDQCMHNYTSTSAYELQELLVRGCHQKHGYQHKLSRNKFNKAIKRFQWLQKEGGGISAPSTQPESAFAPQGSLRWTSRQTITFVLSSVKILAPFFDKSDGHWQCWVKKCAYVEIAQSTKWGWERLIQFNQQIIDHHTLYVSLDKHVTPKWHWESHGPIEVLLHGNLWQVSSFSGEGMHQTFKAMCRRLGSINPILQMVRMISRRVALHKFRSQGKLPAKTRVEGLYCEAAISWSSPLGEALLQDPSIAESARNGAFDGTSVFARWFKCVVHLGDTIKAGTWLMLQIEKTDPITYAHVLEVLEVSGEFFVAFTQCLSGKAYDENGKYLDLETMSAECEYVNVKDARMKLVTVNVISNKVYI